MRAESFGQRGLSLVDRFGVWLSRRAVLRLVDRYDHPSVLDVGCGYEAGLLRDLAPRLGSGCGIDVSISPEALAVRPLSFIQRPVEQALAELKPGTFDLIMMVSVLEHLWEPLPVLRAGRALLRPGGTILINVPTWMGKSFLEFSAFKLGPVPAFEMDDHKMYYSKRDLWPMLVRAGFKPSAIRMRYHKFGLNLFASASSSGSGSWEAPNRKASDLAGAASTGPARVPD